MSLKRILKLLLAFLTRQGVTLVTQLVVPPLFLRRYANGVEVLGEWIALTAAVTYLNTLNYGIQNYANNQMTIHYNGGEVEEAKAVQANALRLILIATLLASAGSATVFLFPLAHWLGLRHVGSFAASLTLFLLILQMVVNWFFALLTNSYMVIGRAHRGQNWGSFQSLTAALAMGVLLWARSSFPVLAAAQVASMILFTGLVLIDVRITAPILLPSLRHGNWRQTLNVVKPSAYFGLLAVSIFLTWQGPVLVIEKLLGPAAVAIFALSRTVFSMSRQLLAVMSFSIGQDITHLVAKKNWKGLHRLYELSEKVVLFLIPVVTVGTLLLCPLLFTVWLHKRTLYEPVTCVLMAAVSAVIGIKEHKFQFQWSSNKHQSLSRFSLFAYVTMIVSSALMVKVWGVDALLLMWLGTEILLTVYIVRLNKNLFPPGMNVSISPVLRLFAMLIVAFALASRISLVNGFWPLVRVTGVALAAVAILAVFDYFFFGLSQVTSVIEMKFRNRLAPVPR